METRIHWTDTAKNDLRKIFAYIAEDNIDAAFSVTDTIENTVDYLATFPFMGKAGRRKETRELKIGKYPTYFVVYTIIDGEVFINSVLSYDQNYK